MATTPVQKAIREVSKAVLEHGFRAAGFRRQGHHLHRSFNDVIHGIHFQTSRWSTAPLGEFTVNLSVTADSLYRYWTGHPLPSNPATATFPINQRIGSLMPERLDRWWKVNTHTDIDALCREVSDALVTYGLPFFDTFPSLESILEGLRKGSSFPGMMGYQGPATLIHAMLAKDSGHEDEAERKICQALEDAGTSLFRETVLLVAHRLSISV
jgi:hypothetical protein